METPQAVNPADTHIWGVYGLLVVLSIIELYSASSFEIAKQGLYAPLLRHVSMLFVGFLIIVGLQRMHFAEFGPAAVRVKVKPFAQLRRWRQVVGPGIIFEIRM